MDGLKQQQKLVQQQRLSPLQMQTIKLLELTTIELEHKIEEEIEENPVLDEVEKKNDEQEKAEDEERNDNADDDYSGDAEDDYSIPSYKLQTHNHSADDKKEYSVLSTGESFQQHLIDQLGFRVHNERLFTIGVFIIGSIDDDGYLRRDLNYICDDIDFKQNIKTTPEEVESILKIIQEFEPVGVGCRNLQECLLLQLKTKDSKDINIKNAMRIVENCFNDFLKKHYKKIIDKLSLSEDETKNAINEITKLNPKPGNIFSDDYSDQGKLIIPDFILDVQNDNISISLNTGNIPDLKINEYYTQMVKDFSQKTKSTGKERDAIKYVKQKIDSAKWFIEAIKQRQTTLSKVMSAIIKLQKNFLISGDYSQLKPMILKNIAEIADVDISTVSRVLNGKYIQTQFGILPLRTFFSESLPTNSGEDVSTREVKSILTDCIAKENKHKPLTDMALVKILQDKGYQIARRTVAKYREQLNIPVARLRIDV